ncbi:MAG: hypothetical protein U1D55_02230 [Phycisphaerae bacterium]
MTPTAGPLPVFAEPRHAAPPTWRVWLIAAIATAAIYLPTTAPGVLWGDSGEAHVRVQLEQWTDAREIARTHLPYYATAIGLHRLGVDAAYAANLVAALAGIATVANFACLLARFVYCPTTLICGTALLALSHTLWQLSSGAEVVTFSTMCLTAELLAFVTFAQTGRPGPLIFAALLNGLGWTTHNFALLMWPAYAVFGVRNARRVSLAPGHVAAIFAAWLAGVAPLIVLFVTEFGRLGTLAAAVRSLLVGGYAGEVLNASVSMKSMARVAAYVALNFPTPMILLTPVGWWRLRERPTRELWIFLTLAGLTYFAFAARYNVPDAYTFLTPSYIFLVLFAAIGIRALLARMSPLWLRVALLLLAVPAPLLYLLTPAIVRGTPALAAALPDRSLPYRDPAEWFLTPWRGGYDGAERFAHEVFGALPPDAWLIIDSTARRPLDYLQLRDHLREDVTLVTENHRRPGQTPIVLDEASARPLIESGRLFSMADAPPYAPAWLVGECRFAPAGHVFRVRPR